MINIYSKKDFCNMRKAGQLAAKTLKFIEKFIKPGISTNILNDLCHEFIILNKATPAPLNYQGNNIVPFPKSICTSINEVVCHGIPSDRILKNGDIINIDITVNLNGWYGDTSRTFLVGHNISNKKKKLVTVTYTAMMKGINIVKPGIYTGDIGYIIEQYVKQNNFSIVKEYTGHGIGRNFHEEPYILHYGKCNTGIKIKTGMFFTIEPMVNIGTHKTQISKTDHWTVSTQDSSLSAQFEHTIGVTNKGVEIFTK